MRKSWAERYKDDPEALREFGTWTRGVRFGVAISVVAMVLGGILLGLLDLLLRAL